MVSWEDMCAHQAARLVAKFGREFTWTPQATGQPATVKGIFDHNYMDDTGGVGIQTYNASVQVNATDVPGIATGDAWADGAIAYTIVKVMPDGDGMIDLLLHKD